MKPQFVFKEEVPVSLKSELAIISECLQHLPGWKGSMCPCTWVLSARTRYSCTSTGPFTDGLFLRDWWGNHFCRPSNFQQTLEHSFDDLSHGLYTDVTLVPDDGEGVTCQYCCWGWGCFFGLIKILYVAGKNPRTAPVSCQSFLKQHLQHNFFTESRAYGDSEVSKYGAKQ